MSRAVAAVAARMAAIAAMVGKGMDRDAATVLLDRAREQAERGGWLIRYMGSVPPSLGWAMRMRGGK